MITCPVSPSGRPDLRWLPSSNPLLITASCALGTYAVRYCWALPSAQRPAHGLLG